MSDRRSKIEALARHPGTSEEERAAATAALDRTDGPLLPVLCRAVVLLLEVVESSSGRIPLARVDEYDALLARLRSSDR